MSAGAASRPARKSTAAKTPAFHPLQIPLGLVLWAVWFAALYGGLSVACAVDPPAAARGAHTALNFALGAMTLVTAASLALLARACFAAAARAVAAQHRFVARIAAGVHLVAFAATLFIGVPLLRLPPCL